MNKKIFTTILFTLATFVTNAAFAVTYGNSVAVGAQVGDARVAAGGISVRANDLIITAETSAITTTPADIPSGSKIIVRLPVGLNFDGAPSFIVTSSFNNGLTLLDAIGDPTRGQVGQAAPAVTLSDTNADGGMDRAEVTVGASGLKTDKVTIQSNVTSPAGTKAATSAKASVIVNSGFAQAATVARIVTSLAEPVDTASGTSLTTVSQQASTDPTGVSTATFVITIPAGTLGGKTITLTPQSKVGWNDGTGANTSTITVSALTPVAAAPITGAGAVGTGTVKVTLTTTGSTKVGSKYDVQVLVSVGTAYSGAQTTTGLKGLTIGGTAGLTGTANLFDVKANGSKAALTKATAPATNKVADLVAGSTAEQTLPTITITENFGGDAVDINAGAGTQTITITPSTGLVFGLTSSITVNASSGLAKGTVAISAKGVMTIPFTRAAAGTKTFTISGLKATAKSTAAGDLSVTVGKPKTDQTYAPSDTLVVANATAVGTVGISGPKKLSKAGPGTTGVSTKITLKETTFGSISTKNNTQVESAYIRFSQVGGATLNSVTLAATGYTAGTEPQFAACVKETGTSGDIICKVTTESSGLVAGTSTVTATINYDVNGKQAPGSKKTAAVIGTTIDVVVGGNALVAGTLSLADVLISTTLSRGAVSDSKPGSTEPQTLAALTITEAFTASTVTGTLRVIAPTGVSFSGTGIIASAVPAGSIGTVTVTATFAPNDTLVIQTEATSKTVTFTPKAVIGPNVSGWLSFQVVDGDADAKSLTNVTAESINLGYADGTLAAFKVGAAVSVNIGFTATNTATGGLAPYQAATTSDKAVATATVVGDQIVVKGLSVGNATITVKDSLDNPKTIAVTVTETTAQPVSEKVKAADGSTTAATFSGGASSDGGETYAATFTTADDISVVGTLNVDAVDVGLNGGIHALISSPTGISYLDVDSNYAKWDGTVAGIGTHIVAEPLGGVYNVTVWSGTAAAGKYRVALAYTTADGKLIYAPKAIIFTVTAE